MVRIPDRTGVSLSGIILKKQNKISRWIYDDEMFNKI